MNDDKIYDAAVIGGGLAGLSLAILLAREGFNIVLFEKEAYPFHKVCGEYISLESVDFIERLGLPVSKMGLPLIKNLVVTSLGGNRLQQQLPLGGFGISRFKIDQELRNIAVEEGVTVMEGCKVENVSFSQDEFSLTTNNGIFTSRTCCGTFGKRSNLDLKLNRKFIKAKGKLNNYIAVKYHINTTFSPDTIALHNFENGYCGISRIEDGKYCLCYLTTAYNLNKCGNSIPRLEKEILSANLHLKNIFEHSTPVFSQPLSISQVSFEKKPQVEGHILMIGDAAGMITPLCGNGMSMALHGSKIASAYIGNYLKGKIDRKKMERDYTKEWNSVFSGRLATGRVIQRFFGRSWITDLFIRVMKASPLLTRKLIEQTHGKPF